MYFLLDYLENLFTNDLINLDFWSYIITLLIEICLVEVIRIKLNLILLNYTYFYELLEMKWVKLAYGPPRHDTTLFVTSLDIKQFGIRHNIWVVLHKFTTQCSWLYFIYGANMTLFTTRFRPIWFSTRHDTWATQYDTIFIVIDYWTNLFLLHLLYFSYIYYIFTEYH